MSQEMVRVDYSVRLYLLQLDRLRRQRTKPGWKPEDDRSLLAELEDIYVHLSHLQRDFIESIGWRAWPDEFAKQGRDGMVAYLTTSAMWKMEPGHTGPVWEYIGGTPVLMFYDELGDDAGKKVMEAES